MKKSIQQLIIILITFLALSVVLFFIWHQTMGQSTKLTSESPKKSTITDPYLKEAKDILNHFSTHTDQYGFYGLMQECQKSQNQYECQVQLTSMYDGGEKRAAWRDGLKVIWARFNYYQATNDQEELTKLEQDIDNLITKVVDNPTTVLQSGDFTCLYLAPIIESSDVSQKTRDQAKRLCLESTIEYAPLSSLAFSQYQRPIVVVTGYSGDDENLPIVGTMLDKIPAEQVTVYTKEQITTQINTNLAAISQYGPYESYSFLMPIKEQPKFFHRQAAAAIDLIFKMNLAQKEGNTELYHLTEIEYLLLIDELFSWYMTNMLELDDDSICLFDQAINYYFGHYPHPLTQDDINFYNSFYWTTTNADLVCQVSQLYLNPQHTLDKQSLKDNISSLSVSDWDKGLMHQITTSDNLYYYPTGYNGLIAGLYALDPEKININHHFNNSFDHSHQPTATSSDIINQTINLEEN